ncbi:PA14 domain-containing protein [Paenibacillus pseudetheri]|uniref:PA14 domain-containing protein n=1 Tax=Paenibacillus pseudetheri TaxID=2897682 RepID=UPI003C6E456D
MLQQYGYQKGLTLTRTDSNVDFNWGLGSPHSFIGGDSFSVQWTGTLRPKISGGRIEYIRYSDGAVVRYGRSNNSRKGVLIQSSDSNRFFSHVVMAIQNYKNGTGMIACI